MISNFYCSSIISKAMLRASKISLNSQNTQALNLSIYGVRLKSTMSNFKPYFAEGEVVKGFGRGSKELEVPTANFPVQVVQKLPKDFDTGVYFGWAQVEESPIYKMVMCVGWNPYYKNKEKSMETHIMHKFDDDFYGKTLRVAVLGYIRPERDFSSLEELKGAIFSDIKQAEAELEKPEYEQFKNFSLLKGN